MNIKDVFNDEMYYQWIIGAAFDMLSDETDYIEFYSRSKSTYIHDGAGEDVFHDVLIGRLSVHDAFYVKDSFLKIVKDADVLNYQFGIVPGAHGVMGVDLSEVVFLRFPKRFY